MFRERIIVDDSLVVGAVVTLSAPGCPGTGASRSAPSWNWPWPSTAEAAPPQAITIETDGVERHPGRSRPGLGPVLVRP